MADCDEPECLQALTRLQLARNRILSLCDLITQLSDAQSRHRALVAAFSTIALALAGTIAVIMTFVPFPFNLIAAAAVAAALIAVLVAMALQFAQIAHIEADIQRAQQDLATARAEFDSAVAEVMANCDEDCWEDLDLNQPSCQETKALVMLRGGRRLLGPAPQ